LEVQHGKKTVKLGRTQSHRDAMLANMATSLFLHEKIKTTTTKAKVLRPLVDKLITTAKQGTLHSKRQVARTIRDKAVLKKLFNEIVPQFDERNSGYSRMMRAGFRKGDGAELAIVELSLERVEAEATEKKKGGRLSRLTGRKKKEAATETASAEKKGKGKKKAAAAEAPAEEESKAEVEAEEPEAGDNDADGDEEKPKD
jgi:large subunit ribosomal protein L17